MTTKMNLYFAQGACALGPQITLREAGLDFDLTRVNLKDHVLFETTTDYYTINPKGAVPALKVDGGHVLTEGPAIYQYIADQAPAKKLAPANGTIERTMLQEHLNYITSELHKGTALLFSSDLPESFRAAHKERMVKKFGFMDAILAKTPYLMGQDFSVADAYLYNITRWTGYDAIKIDISSLKNLAAFMGRMQQRPSVQAALQAEGLPQ